MSMQFIYRYQIILGNFNRYQRYTSKTATTSLQYVLLHFLRVRVATSSEASRLFKQERNFKSLLCCIVRLITGFCCSACVLKKYN